MNRLYFKHNDVKSHIIQVFEEEESRKHGGDD